MTAKNPQDCNSVEEIRQEIDRIDRQIFALFSERHKYVEEIVKFKTDEAGIIAHERKQMVIQQRKSWAAKNGLNPETFEKMYELLIESNIEHEMRLLQNKNNPKE